VQALPTMVGSRPWQTQPAKPACSFKQIGKKDG